MLWIVQALTKIKINYLSPYKELQASQVEQELKCILRTLKMEVSGDLGEGSFNRLVREKVRSLRSEG